MDTDKICDFLNSSSDVAQRIRFGKLTTSYVTDSTDERISRL